MNFAFTEDQAMIRDAARGWLADFAPPAHVRQVMATAEGYDPALWAEVAAMGWTGLIVPEEAGGSGLGFVELAILCEEMGRRLYPSPF
ncbi:MAG: acyl-CoA dehydrogenase family protein, partial [Zavarzinia sp.]|nr:acyl-CoA dehydrogenase family protein [Zavarzinia sp.]